MYLHLLGITRLNDGYYRINTMYRERLQFLLCAYRCINAIISIRDFRV